MNSKAKTCGDESCLTCFCKVKMGLEQEELDRALRDNPDLAKKNPKLGIPAPVGGATPSREHKYHALPGKYNGEFFHSKKEAHFARDLDLQIKAGVVSFYLRQVPFHLEGAKYLVDFLIFYADRSVRFVDTKGVDTPLSKTKRRMVEVRYPIKIEII